MERTGQTRENVAWNPSRVQSDGKKQKEQLRTPKEHYETLYIQLQV